MQIPESPYIAIPSQPFEGDHLSLEAKGLLVSLLVEGRGEMRKDVLLELKEKGFFRREDKEWFLEMPGSPMGGSFFSPPSESEVQEYCDSIGIVINVSKFLAVKKLHSWKTKTGITIVDWKAAVDYWFSWEKPAVTEEDTSNLWESL